MIWASISFCAHHTFLTHAAGVLKAGFAERDITPAIGSEIPGGYGKAFHKSFHDPCKVRAAVFDDGQKRVALVGTDSLIIPRHLVLAARRLIQERCGIPPGAVMIGASHSHSSGPIGFVQPGEYDHASELVKKLAYEKSPCADPKYVDLVRDAIADAVCAANDTRAPVSTSFGTGLEDTVAFNRRLRMKNGLTFSHPGRGNPEILDYAGPIDPQVNVIGAWLRDGKLAGCIVNYTCHATTSPGGISANWIYYLEKTIRGYYGPEVVVVFLQGACGDITQVDNLSPHADWPGDRMAQLVGGSVGAEAIKVLLRSASGTNAIIAATQKVWPIRRRVPSPEHLKQALETVQKSEREACAALWTFAKETLLLDALIARDPQVEVEVQAIQVGPSVFVSNPAEFFVQLGLEIKKQSPFPMTSIVELANGCVGYVPTEEAFGPNGGGYETRLTSYSNLEVTAGTQMARAGVELIRSMKPGPMPQRPKAPPFTAPWAYGNLGPQRD
ncbi:MAG: hypothetical protein HY735_19045 [Verrucomicrobia bacterium]|nr:hypothetical protein [Verrucomicrobiota bacterium]